MSVPLLHMSAIAKRFPGVVALDGVDIETANVGGTRTLEERRAEKSAAGGRDGPGKRNASG